MTCENRSKKCILAFANMGEPPKTVDFQLERKTIPSTGFTFRTMTGSQDLDKNHKGSLSLLRKFGTIDPIYLDDILIMSYSCEEALIAKE